MTIDKSTPWAPYNFLALTPEQSALASASAVLIPVPYDSTTSYRTGARYGPAAILAASYNLEDYDHELDFDLSQAGIHTTAALEPHMAGPEAMIRRVAQAVESYDDGRRLVGLLGGEHTITVGAVRAMRARRSNLSVLYLDAHGDLRDTYMDTPYSHACVARRLMEICPVVQVGVRSLSREEFALTQNPPPNLDTYLWHAEAPRLPNLRDVLSRLTPEVYVSIDLDALDPSIMAAVGTPEPGGMGWSHVMQLIDAVARRRRIVGFDVVELSPNEGPHACAYTAAKLVYKLIGSALARNADAIHISRSRHSRGCGNPSSTLATPQPVGAVREPPVAHQPAEQSLAETHSRHSGESRNPSPNAPPHFPSVGAVREPPATSNSPFPLDGGRLEPALSLSKGWG